MKLVVFSEDTILCSGDIFSVVNPLTRLYGCLAGMVGEVVVSGPVNMVSPAAVSEGWMDRLISYSPRPYYGGSVTGFFRMLPRIMAPTFHNIDKNIRKADMVMIRVPSPIGFLAWVMCRWHGTPCFIYIAGDVLEVVARGEKYHGLLRLVASGMAGLFHALTRFMARKSLVFTTGGELKSRFGKTAGRCVNFLPSLVSDQDIFYRMDACEKKPVQLLFVGRLVPVKGLSYLLDAVALLKARRVDVRLNIVGDGYHRPVLENAVRELGIECFVNFLGRIPFGPDLFKIYRMSDIFVLPSLSEGLPKALLEAMASGLPIIATSVGSVPDAVKDGQTGFLIKARSPDAIVSAVCRLLSDHERRRQIIENGYDFVSNCTIEKQAEMMWHEIRDFFALEEL